MTAAEGARRRILIVGGGTAGWLTAAYLAKTLGANLSGGTEITLIESSDIGIIGVGEGTFPTIRSTLAAIGIDEARFLRESTATFKQGVHFVDWAETPAPDASPTQALGTVAGHSHYFHPFNFPHQGNGPELLPYWLLGGAGDAPFAEAVTLQKAVADASRGPKRAIDPPYAAPLNYAYHFDANRLAVLLRTVAIELGVRHRVGTVTDVVLDGSGAVARVDTREHGSLSADLYIDCSGFRAEIIGRALKVPFKSYQDVLFNDRAVALQVPYDRPDAPIPSYTVATAHEAGWTWDIGLNDRRGTGYVYSSRHTDDARAEQVLRRYLGPAAEGRDVRLLKFDSGCRTAQWVGNCVAVGLSGGFFEPLESTGIMLIEVAAHMIAQYFPWGETGLDSAQTAASMAATARTYNALMGKRYERIVDFLKLHYCITRRTDSAYWRDNADPATIPESLRDRLAVWAHRPPGRFDFVADHETFLPASYQYVLYGMGFKTDLEPARALHRRMDEARHEFRGLRTVAPQAVSSLPTHRELVEEVYRNGFRPPQAAQAVGGRR
ncbi:MULTISPECIES: tryptophan halogenase family protein [Nitrospirillum]|uniref:Tryptophan halogenase n=1 Tax=Nitrospirillum amazonense TaxID=28077 RepID=A0A560G1W5_9PROT|nr:tryptophan halogenase family protein [Nitrospirillum amazonense]MEC4595012.1 tryptophan halogenase family protein [Nitrospirillum amazonense]TWB27839.1 tryptophan halogenase [Nitrospirillum amazonense]